MLARLPIEMTVEQRSTSEVPGSDGALRLTIDDITGGQVIVALMGESGAPLLGPVSLKAGASERFELGRDVYVLTLEELDKSWLGEDSARFSVTSSTGAAASAPVPAASAVSEPVSEPVSEEEKIERLLEIVGSLEGVTFLRNGKEHTAAEAVDHLRSKWKAAGGRVSTAREFVERIATKSSSSGKPYEIRLPDGSVVSSGEYLGEQLDRIERGH